MVVQDNVSSERRVRGDRRSGNERRDMGSDAVGFVGGFEIPQERSGVDRRKTLRRREDNRGDEKPS